MSLNHIGIEDPVEQKGSNIPSEGGTSKKGGKLTKGLAAVVGLSTLSLVSCNNSDDDHFDPGGSLKNKVSRMLSPGDTHVLDSKISDDHESAPEHREVVMEVVVNAELTSDVLNKVKGRLTTLRDVKNPSQSVTDEINVLTSYQKELIASKERFITQLYLSEDGKASKTRIEQGVQGVEADVDGETYDSDHEVSVKKVEQIQGRNGSIEYRVTLSFVDENNGTNIHYDAVLRGEATVMKNGGSDHFKIIGVDRKEGLELREVSGPATRTSGSKAKRIYKTKW